MLVFVPDIEPAQSVKAIARLAKRVAVSVADSLAYVQEGKAVVTGYPLGQRVTKWAREEARAVFGLAADVRVLLVFGGSRGARSINRAVMENIAALAEMAHVVHISGRLDWPEVASNRDALPAAIQERYQAYPYLHERMGAALAAVDLVVSRAGAGVLGEFPYFGLPAILVPYPYAWRYQKVNANWLADRGAAVIVEDDALTSRIAETVKVLLDDSPRLQTMSEAASALARRGAARDLARELVDLAQGGGLSRPAAAG
jgi:UDP-N-acetylglucosamine--N-acetylmuramyl-(pentapeptide) pyrophosphoryl-undecaprenol N-acetylglucosamine transferase